MPAVAPGRNRAGDEILQNMIEVHPEHTLGAKIETFGADFIDELLCPFVGIVSEFAFPSAAGTPGVAELHEAETVVAFDTLHNSVTMRGGETDLTVMLAHFVFVATAFLQDLVGMAARGCADHALLLGVSHANPDVVAGDERAICVHAESDGFGILVGVGLDGVGAVEALLARGVELESAVDVVIGLCAVLKMQHHGGPAGEDTETFAGTTSLDMFVASAVLRQQLFKQRNEKFVTTSSAEGEETFFHGRDLGAREEIVDNILDPAATFAVTDDIRAIFVDRARTRSLITE